MANQIIIDIGAVANDGTGDPLRTAFNYVNDNFSNVWASGVANSNIGFSGNKILTTNTNGNLILAPNGIGKIQSNVDIRPNANNTLSLGTSDLRWNSVYTQNLDVGGNVSFNNVTVGGNLTVQGNIIQVGNIVTETLTIQLANAAVTANSANGSGITVGANDNIATLLYNSSSNVWTTNIGITASGNVAGTYFIGNGSQLTGISSYSNTNATSLLAAFGSNSISTTGNITAGYFIGNGSQLTGVTSYANANAVAYGEAGWAGNIIPSGNAVYSLGNATNQWNDLYVSNSTIYMNSVPISLTAGNVLTVNGADVVTTAANGESSIGNLDIIGATISVAAGAPETYINLSANVEGWAYVQVPTDATANVYNTRIHNDAGNIEFGTGDYSTGSTGYIWTLDNTGNLNLPNGGAIENRDDISILITNATVQDGEITIEANAAVNIYGGSTNTAGQSGGGVNINGGDGGPDSGDGVGTGGEIEISGGTGAPAINGGAGIGGEVRIVGGSGGGANAANSIAANTGGPVYIFGGQSGDVDGNNALAVAGPDVEIHGGLGSFNGSTMVGIPGDVITQGGGNGWIGASGNVMSKTSPDGYDFYVWKYDNAGRTIYPTLSTQRGDATSGTISGYTIRIGDGAAEAIITTPDGDANTNPNSQRLVINPGKGADGTSGEGGDIYLWAGRGADTGGSGGDIKIRGGQGGTENGAGGYIRMEAGDGDTIGTGQPGFVEITSGRSGGEYAGGYVRIAGGQGGGSGGEANITGGYGSGGDGGAVNIVGGGSGIGLAEYGNVNISAGASTWSFDNTGVLTVPGEGIIRSVDDTVTLTSLNTSTGNANSVYVGSAGGLGFNDQEIGGNWLEIFRTGTEPEIRVPVGRGNLNIKTAQGENAYNWTFDNTGNVTIPGEIHGTGNLTLQTPSGIPASVADWNGGGGWNQGSYTNLATTGGTGTGLTVDVAADGSGYITINDITINTPGTGYTNGDVITIENENNLTGTFTIIVTSNSWTFDNTGVLTVPGNIAFTNNYVYSGNTFTSPETNGILKNFKWEFSDLSSGADTVTLQWNLLDTTFPQWYLTTNSQGNTYVFDGDAKTLGFLDNSINSGTLTFGTAANNGAGTSNDIELTTVTGNAYVRTGSNSWKFDNTGNLTAPGNIIANNLSATNNDGTGRNIKVGDDTWLGDINVSNTLSLRGQQDGANAYIVFGNASNVALGRAGTGPLTYGGDFSVAGNITGNTAGYAIGYRDIPQVSFTGNATIATTDAGKHYYSTESTNYTLTIANNASQGFQVGAAITVVNQGTGNITIAQGSGVTLYMAGNATSGNRSVATFGMATIMKVATDTWFVSGVGVA